MTALEPSKKALTGILAHREKMAKKYGTALTRQNTESTAYEIVSSGSVAIDYATVVGGFVKGRIHLHWGAEGCGKTTEIIRALAEEQKAYPDLAVAYIDMEQTFDFEWAEKNGLDTREHRFIHLFPENSEDVADMMKDACMSGVVSAVAVDSVGGMVTKKATEKDADESDMGKNSQVVTRMCQITAVVARKNKVTVHIVSQVRADFKSQNGIETYAAPKALRHATSMVLAYRQNGTMLKAKIEDEEIPVGKPVGIRIERSKVAAGGRKADVTILNVATAKYGPIGFDIVDEAYTVGTKPSVKGIIKQPGGYYLFPDGERVRSEATAREYLRKHPEVVEKVRLMAIESVKNMVQDEAPELVFVPGDIEEESA